MFLVLISHSPAYLYLHRFSPPPPPSSSSSIFLYVLVDRFTSLYTSFFVFSICVVWSGLQSSFSLLTKLNSISSQVHYRMLRINFVLFAISLKSFPFSDSINTLRTSIFILLTPFSIFSAVCSMLQYTILYAYKKKLNRSVDMVPFPISYCFIYTFSRSIPSNAIVSNEMWWKNMFSNMYVAYLYAQILTNSGVEVARKDKKPYIEKTPTHRIEI